MEKRNYSEQEIRNLGKLTIDVENGGITHSILRALEKDLKGKNKAEIEAFFRESVSNEAKINILKIATEIENSDALKNREKRGEFKIVYKGEKFEIKGKKTEKSPEKKEERKTENETPKKVDKKPENPKNETEVTTKTEPETPKNQNNAGATFERPSSNGEDEILDLGSVDDEAETETENNKLTEKDKKILINLQNSLNEKYQKYNFEKMNSDILERAKQLGKNSEEFLAISNEVNERLETVRDIIDSITDENIFMDSHLSVKGFIENNSNLIAFEFTEISKRFGDMENLLKENRETEKPQEQAKENQNQTPEKAKEKFDQELIKTAEAYIKQMENAKQKGKNVSEIEKLINEANNLKTEIINIRETFTKERFTKESEGQGIEKFITDSFNQANKNFHKIAENMNKAIDLSNKNETVVTKNNLSKVISESLEELNLDFDGVLGNETLSKKDFEKNFSEYISGKNPEANFTKAQIKDAIQKYLDYKENIDYGKDMEQAKKTQVFDGIYNLLAPNKQTNNGQTKNEKNIRKNMQDLNNSQNQN